MPALDPASIAWTGGFINYESSHRAKPLTGKRGCCRATPRDCLACQLPRVQPESQNPVKRQNEESLATWVCTWLDDLVPMENPLPQALEPNKVAALIPCYHEEATIADVVSRVRKILDGVLVVDDGSKDATAAQARVAGAQVIVHRQNMGKGAAIKTGLRALLERGDFEYFVILDGDGQHLPEEIASFLQKATEIPAAIYVGNRMSRSRNMPLVRKLTNKYMSWEVSRHCGQPVPDSQCGFRMVSRRLAANLFCESNGYDYETEMLLVAAAEGHRIVSVPVSTVYAQETSWIRPIRDGLRFFKLLRRYPKAHTPG